MLTNNKSHPLSLKVKDLQIKWDDLDKQKTIEFNKNKNNYSEKMTQINDELKEVRIELSYLNSLITKKEMY